MLFSPSLCFYLVPLTHSVFLTVLYIKYNYVYAIFCPFLSPITPSLSFTQLVITEESIWFKLIINLTIFTIFFLQEITFFCKHFTTMFNQVDNQFIHTKLICRSWKFVQFCILNTADQVKIQKHKVPLTQPPLRFNQEIRLLRTNSPIHSTIVCIIAGWPWRTQSTASAPATAYKETTLPQVTPSKNKIWSISHHFLPV